MKIALVLGLAALIASAASANTQSFMCNDMTGILVDLESAFTFACGRLNLRFNGYQILSTNVKIQSIFLVKSQICFGVSIFVDPAQVIIAYRFSAAAKEIIAKVALCESESELRALVNDVADVVTVAFEGLKKVEVVVQQPVGIIDFLLALVQGTLGSITRVLGGAFGSLGGIAGGALGGLGLGGGVGVGGGIL